MQPEHCSTHEKCTDDINDLKTKVSLLENYYDATDERVTKHKEDNLLVFERIEKVLKELKEAIVGTIDKKGLKTLVMEHEEFIRPQRESWNGLINWVYKGMMLAGMAMVLYLLGFKHLIGG